MEKGDLQGPSDGPMLLHELGELRALARQVLNAHRAEYGNRLHEIWALIADLLEDLDPHLRDEQRAVPAPRRLLQSDHSQMRVLLDDLRCETRGYRAPEGVCATWMDLWRRLAALDAALSAQMRREELLAEAPPQP